MITSSLIKANISLGLNYNFKDTVLINMTESIQANMYWRRLIS